MTEFYYSAKGKGEKEKDEREVLMKNGIVGRKLLQSAIR